MRDDKVWIPACDADGTFAAKQFHAAKRQSFCVDQWGSERPSTRVRGKGAKCKKARSGQ